MFLTRVHDRLLPTGLSHLTDTTDTGPLHRAALAYQHALDNLLDQNGLAASSRPHRHKLDPQFRLRRT